jgi:hypothetical protein
MAHESRPPARKLNRAQMAIFFEQQEDWTATVHDARAVLRDDLAGIERWSHALTVLCSAHEISVEVGRENKPSPEFLEDLLTALKRGGTVAKAACHALYDTTKRPLPMVVTDHAMDPTRWRDYLVAKGFLKAP